MGKTIARCWGFAVTGAATALVIFPGSGSAERASTLTSALSGAEVVPPPGDPDARGSARITIRGTRLCWRLVVPGIQAPHAAHIHVGRRGQEGPPIVPLFLRHTSLERPKRGCVRAGAVEARDIASRPGRYYVNVHNDEFPNGAVRGQLRASRRAAPRPRAVGEPRFTG